MNRLASQWKMLLLVVVVAGIAIFVFEPDYNTLQMSSDANDFTSVLGDNEGRALAANISDMVFALVYGLLGVIAFHQLAAGKTALFGSLLVVGAAAADEVENVLVFLNLTSDALTDGMVNAMTTVGLIKWALIAATFALALVLLLRRMRIHRAS